MFRVSRRAVGTALAGALLSLTGAHAESGSDKPTSRNFDDVFAQVTALSKQNEWQDDLSVLGYAKPRRTDAVAPWVTPQQLPAVDGINAKIAGFGGGDPAGFYGANGSLSVPLGQQWGLQLDGEVGSASGIGEHGGAGHLFWRDPSIGLLGAYASYWHWNGTNDVNFGRISANVGRFAVEGEYYLNRWTLSGLIGVETLRIKSALPIFSVANHFFDDVSVSYYPTDNFKLSAGHIGTFGTHFLTLGSEYGFALGGGRMASLFADGWIGERSSGGLVGLRMYFGQRDKSLMDRHRQDDPRSLYDDVMQYSLELMRERMRELDSTPSRTVREVTESFKSIVENIR